MNVDKNIESLKKIIKSLVGEKIVIEELIYQNGKDKVNNRAQVEINVKSWTIIGDGFFIDGDSPLEYPFSINDIYSIETFMGKYIIKETLPYWNKKRESIIKLIP